MGALIFLLLITVRRIQQQAQVEVTPVEVPIPLVVDEPPRIPETPELPLTAIPESKLDPEEPILPELTALTQEDVDWEREQWELRQQQRRADYEARVKNRNNQAERLIAQWQKRAAQLLDKLTEVTKTFESITSTIRALEEENEEATSVITLGTKRLDETRQSIEKLENEIADKQADRLEITNKSAELTRQIARAEEQLAKVIAATEIVAFDTATGTSRKPILIECTEKEIRFAAEGISITAEELSGFPPEYNPLKAGTEALLNYWAENGKRNEKPYVLLVVRPQGTTGFYVARGLLSKLDHHFGYELVSESTDLNWPKTDPEAVAACQRAVQSVLAERERVAARIGRGLASANGPMQFADSQGRFALPEAESARRPSHNGFLDEKWIPPNRRAKNFVEKPSLNAPRSTPQLSNRGTSQREFESNKTDPAFQTNTRSNRESKNSQFRNREPLDLLSDDPSQDSSGQSRQLPPGMLPQIQSRELAANRQGESSPGQQSMADMIAGNQRANGEPWSFPAPRGAIGIERQIVVHLWPDRIKIDDGLEVNIPPGSSATELQRLMTTEVRRQTNTWKPAPRSFFWKPTVKAMVHPGGNQHAPRVQELADRWSVEFEREYTLQ